LKRLFCMHFLSCFPFCCGFCTWWYFLHNYFMFDLSEPGKNCRYKKGTCTKQPTNISRLNLNILYFKPWVDGLADLQIIILLGRTNVRPRQNIVRHLSASLGQCTKKNVSYFFEHDVFLAGHVSQNFFYIVHLASLLNRQPHSQGLSSWRSWVRGC
jgi:hypothetical protein